MGITKVSNGLILNDDFNNSFNPLWDVLPNDANRVLFNEDSIVLSPIGEYTEMLIPCPNNSFIMQSEVNYIPKSISDIGGVIIKSLTNYSTEARFSYEDEEIDLYKYIRFSYNDDYVINLRASKDNITWDDLGNNKLYDGNYIGYYVKGNENFEIKSCLICKDKYVIIQGIKVDDSIELLDSEGTNIISKYDLDNKIIDDRLLIDITNASWPIKNVTLCVNLNKTGGATYYLGDLYGGDVFSFDPELLFSIDEINETESGFDLGEIYGASRNYTLRVFNNGLEHKTGRLVVSPVSTYDRGSQMVYIYPIDSDFNDKPKELEVSITPGSEFACIIKVMKESKYIAIDGEFSFNIIFMK